MKNSVKLSIVNILTLSCLWGCTGTIPNNLGVTDNRLIPCPSSPNCVSSYATDEKHTIEAIPLNGTIPQTKKQLISILNTLEAKIVTDQDNYIRAEFTSNLLKFVDDVEFYIEDQGVQVRSASRIGRSDFNANRERIENIRKKLSSYSN